jgi:hypothetical protein
LRSPEHILAAKKPAVLRRYMERMKLINVPDGILIPEDPREALLLGMRIARRKAYEDGLVDGVHLGIDVFFEAASH